NCTTWYSYLTQSKGGGGDATSQHRHPGAPARRRRRLRGRAWPGRPQPAHAGRRARHEPPDADLPLRLQGGTPPRGGPRGRGPAAGAAGRAPGQPRARSARPDADALATPDVAGAVALRAALLRGLRAGPAGQGAREAAARGGGRGVGPTGRRPAGLAGRAPGRGARRGAPSDRGDPRPAARPAGDRGCRARVVLPTGDLDAVGAAIARFTTLYLHARPELAGRGRALRPRT